MTREEAIKVLNDLRQFTYEETEEALDMAIKSLNEWTEYSDKLWKIAYERGKADALKQTEPTNALKDTETKEHDDLAKLCENFVKDCKTDLISRADLFRELTIDAYGMFDAEDGIVLAVPLDIITHEIDNAPSVSAEPKSKVDTTENLKCDFTSAERVDCDSCIYKTMWQEQEKAETLDRHTLDVLQERFEAEELKAHAKSSGLKEHAVWNKAIRILEEYMEEGDNDND